jgi:hypothetical protein
LVAEIGPQGEGRLWIQRWRLSSFEGWSSPSASSLMPSLVVEANAALGFVGRMSYAKYIL